MMMTGMAICVLTASGMFFMHMNPFMGIPYLMCMMFMHVSADSRVILFMFIIRIHFFYEI